jgi:hypothetical protein
MSLASHSDTWSIGGVHKPGFDVDQELEEGRADLGCVALNERQVLILGGWGTTRGGGDGALAAIEILTLAAR